MVKRLGGCLCGKVTYSVEGMPIRVGICHCTDCRQESGSAFTYFGIWPASAFETSSDETHQYAGPNTADPVGLGCLPVMPRKPKSSLEACRMRQPVSRPATSFGSSAVSHGCLHCRALNNSTKTEHREET